MAVNDTENGTKEEKNLALEQKIRQIIDNIQFDEEGKVKENSNEPLFIEIAGTRYELEIDFDKENNSYKIHMLGIHILTLDENNQLSFEKGWEEKLRETLKNSGQTVETEGLIEELQRMEKELNKTKEQRAKEVGTKEDLDGDEKEENEKDNEKKPENEEDKDEKKEQIAKQYNVSARNVVHIAKDEKVTKDHRFEGVANWVKGYDDVYVIQGEDDKYSCKFIGSKKGEQEEIDNKEKQIGGKNPDITITRIDGDEITEVKPLAMYEIDEQTSMAVVKNKYGEPELLYCRQQGGDEKRYFGTIVPEASGKNVLQVSPDTREMIDSRYNSKEDLSKKSIEVQRQRTLEERGLPSKQKGVQVDEIDGNANQNRTQRIEGIVEDLIKDDKMAERLTTSYDAYRNKAEKILKIMESNEDILYKDAKAKVEESEKRHSNDEKDDDYGPWASRRPR